MTELTIPDVIGVEPDRMEDNMVDETVFSPDFDLALIVGSEKTRPEKERILVSSVVLRFASPVFAAMLSPPWKESQGLSTKKGSIMELELPEDDATAMKFICAILHHQNNDKIVKEVPSGRTFLHVAILTDKYDFYRALNFVLVSVMKAASYASPLKDRAPKSELREVGFATDDLHKRQLLAWPDLLDFAAAAYLLNDCEWFSKFAFDLMAIHRGSFAEFLLDDLVSSVLPPRFAVLLGERALQFRLNVLKDMQERLKSDSEYHSPCPAGEFITEAFEDFVAKFHNTSTDDGFCKSLASLLYELEDLAGEDRSFLDEDCEIDGKRHDDSFPSDRFSLEIELKDLRMRAVLCINLVRLRPSCNAGHIHR